MNDGGQKVIGRCASCHEKGVDQLRVWDGNGNVFLSSDQKYVELARSQRSPDSISLAGTLLHIPWVASCGCCVR